MRTIGQREEHLKEYGLRNVEVCEAHQTVIEPQLNFIFYRIFFGASKIQIPIKPYHMIVCMQTILVYLRITCGRKQNS